MPCRVRQPLLAPPVLNQTWALDFMADALDDRRRFRALTILDEGNREGLAIDIGRSVPARRVIPLRNSSRCTGGQVRCAWTTVPS